ncbi:hypothetical protein [Marinobacter salexigens]|uniref:hypothetical protein n=1 Tax=Marinobacter salexigens TaxID=1925763 RepID=UPI000C28C0DC|nr:hypothetical protein [Marinobacter salexigens]
MSALDFRRQYIISGSELDPLPGWERVDLFEQLIVCYHPDLEVARVSTPAGGLVVLGYIVDPLSPELTTLEIAKGLAGDSSSFDDLLKHIFGLSGRYVIVYWNGSEAKLVHDACALRKAFYLFDGDEVYCASQPGLIKHYKELVERKDADLIEFMSSESFMKSESSWVGDETIYEGVRQLMPNSYLDIRGGDVKRYWLNNLEQLSFDETVKEVSRILKGSVDAITRRGEVMQSVTAGWDSRVLLAASRYVSDKVYYFVNTMNVYNDDHMDIAVPKTMLGDMGLELNIFKNMPKLRDDFFSRIQVNVEGARNLPKTLAIQYYHDFHYGKLNVNGNGSEVARSYYGSDHVEWGEITTDYVLSKAGLDKNSLYLKGQVEKWLSDVKDLVEDGGFNIMDLFYWEQRMGNWGGMFMAEQDIAVEGFMPFNNRKLLVLALALDAKYRAAPNHTLHKNLIEEMWPELLKYPINPETLKSKIKKAAKKVIPSGAKDAIKALLQS